MGDPKTRAGSFLAAVGTLGLAGVLTRGCPGSCQSCVSCANALVPLGASVAAVGGAFVTSAVLRHRSSNDHTGGRDAVRKARGDGSGNP